MFGLVIKRGICIVSYFLHVTFKPNTMIQKYQEHIKQLESKLIEEKSLSRVMDYFLTHLGESPEFMEHSVPLKDHESLRSLMERHLKVVSKKTQKIHLFLSRVKRSHFIHGCCIAGQYSYTLLYFEKSNLGLLVQQPVKINEKITYLKFALIEKKPPLVVRSKKA